MTEGFTIVNPDRDRLGAVMAKHGLKAIKRGHRLNTAYTPKNCRAIAERVTGKKFKARDYDGMIEALEAKIKTWDSLSLGEQGKEG